MDERKEGMNRRKITFHSFRRHLKGVLSNQVNTDYSEWFLGHNKSPYYTLKQEQRRDIYLRQCMKWLTFLDFSLLQNTSKNIELKLEEKEKEISYLREKEINNSNQIAIMTLKQEKEMKEVREHMEKIVSMIQGESNLLKQSLMRLQKIMTIILFSIDRPNRNSPHMFFNVPT